ncbi:primosomal replication protein N [Laribacter hongkongensis]|uniref:primosomal replication protein N n=1 Tax=Laribacter hongkongensis TaxID=168471 RepID=UPI0023D7E8F3|nr:primosomal replication protein N [Laribacter hongkongensis]
MLNQVTVEGTLHRFLPLRHTPAGIPVLSCELEHESEQSIGKMTRKIRCEVEVIAAGTVARSLSACPEGSLVILKGCLANRSMRSSRLVLHVQSVELKKV